MSMDGEVMGLREEVRQMRRELQALKENSGRQVTRQAIGGGGGGSGLRIVVKDTKTQLDAVVNQYSFPTLGATRNFHKLYWLREHRWSDEDAPVKFWLCISDGEIYDLEMPPLPLFGAGD